MSEGFFPESELITVDKPDISTVSTLLPKCGACGLFRLCQSPKMPLYGKGRKSILIVGEFPGSVDDADNEPFVGMAGTYLREKLEELDVDLHEDCWVTNALICRPPHNNIKKYEASIEYCRPNLLKVIADKNPKVIILLGLSAVRSLIPWLWKDDPGAMARWVGWNIPSQVLNAWVCPIHHPSYVLACLKDKDSLTEGYFEQHLSVAIDRAHSAKRPWKEIPKWDISVVKTFLNPVDAIPLIKQVMRMRVPTAWDYECNSLKPHYEGAEILCASISTGPELTFAYMMQGKAIKKWHRRFIQSDVPKIASKLQFEDGWSRVHFGCGVKKWYFDTMLGAHAMDCRPNITSIKFLAFVLLGVGDYSDHIEPYLRSAIGTHINLAATEITPVQLLEYNGLDSLYELLVAKRIIKQLNLV